MVNQIVDSDYASVGKIATFEPSFWKLDGSFMLPSIATDSQYGLRTKVLSDENGAISSGNVLAINFSKAVSAPGITIYFDANDGQFASSLTLTGSLDGSVVKTVTVDNASTVFVLDDGFQGINRLEITFHSTNEPLRGLRIVEIEFGLFLEFDTSTLFKSTLISEFDPQSKVMPQNELSFSAINTNGRYSYGAFNSYSQYLQERQRFTYRHGLFLGDFDDDGNIEWLNMGNYYLESWKVDDHKVEFTCKPSVYQQLRQIYPYYSLNSTSTIGAMIEAVLRYLGLTGYTIATALYYSPLITTYAGEITCEALLLNLAKLGGAHMFVNPNGSVSFAFMDTSTAVDKLDYDNMLKSPFLNLSAYYNAVMVDISTPTGGSSQNLQSHVGTPPGVAGQRQYLIPLKQAAFTVTAVAISGTGNTLNGYVAYTQYVVVTITHTAAAANFTVNVTGTPLQFSTYSETIDAPWRLPGEPTYAYSLSAPMLLNDARLPNLLSYAVNNIFEVLRYRLSAELIWRQNPAEDVADVLNVQITNAPLYKNFKAIKQELVFSGGALRGSTSIVAKEA